ncbi:hypothetical protein HP550_19355 [Cellulomonas humilata]|uniref:Lipoprotein n=1 Tax=Cellulomonas humilata TaxID=144055 RepID=A0A7Y6A460_9CELL|nr:hypothetical protein [Cellulomonas humilata]NUU19411.1 hypothetical protein [Cellulomonas humilata]
MRGPRTVLVVVGALLLSACGPVGVEREARAITRVEQPSPTASPTPSTPTPDPTVEARWAEAIEAAYYAMEYVLEPADLPAISAAWGAAVTAQFGTGSITVDPALFAPVTNEWGMTQALDNGVTVVGDDPAAVRVAMAAAATRFFAVDAEGVEHADAESLDLAEGRILDYVSDPTDDGTGLGYWIDTEGVGYPEAARTMMTILVEELERAGVTEARLVPLGPSGTG